MTCSTIEEALHAKRKAEEEILRILRKLSAETGMQIQTLDLRFSSIYRLGDDQVSLVTEVGIDLRL